MLPAADFTTFLAACHRHLSREEFATVSEVYYDTARRLLGDLTVGRAGALAGV